MPDENADNPSADDVSFTRGITDTQGMVQGETSQVIEFSLPRFLGGKTVLLRRRQAKRRDPGGDSGGCFDSL